MKLVVSRHRQTDWNAEGRIQGQTDRPLNETGWEQSRALARDVSAYGITKLFCSDLLRARQTASCVEMECGVIAVPEPRLRECNFGSLEGVKHQEFGLRYGPKHKFGFDALNADFRRFGGESGRQVLNRQLEALADIKAGHADEIVMIIGHGRSLRVLLQHLKEPYKFLRDQTAHHVIWY